MKVEILKDNLKSGLSVAEKVVGKNLSLPILDNVLINTEDSFLNLTSTDLETVIRLWILSKVVQKGQAVVPVKILSSFISSLPEEKVTIETKEKNLHVESKNFKTQIQGFNSEEFPLIPQFKDLESLEINNALFCQGLSQVVTVASPSQTRPEISGIYFSFAKKLLTLAATDSFRLAEKQIPLENPTKKEYAFILPQKAAREIITILENKQGNLKIHFSNNQVQFELSMEDVKHPAVQITSRLIDGQYPNYQEIIPNKFKTLLALKKDEFLTQIKIASLFSGRNNEIKLSINAEKNEVEVISQNPTIGENHSHLTARVDGESLVASFNYKFLLEGLQNIKSSEMIFSLSKEDGPAVMRPVGDASYLYVVMPIKSI